MPQSIDVEEKIIDKIQKLLALSTSSNEHEAALAASRVKDMMSKYNLSLSEVNVRKEKIIRRPISFGHQTNPVWLKLLSNYIAKAFDCKMYIHYSLVFFIGTEVDTKVAEYMLSYLTKTVEVMAQDFKSRRNPSDLSPKDKHSSNKKYKAQTDYSMGVVNGIKSRLESYTKQFRVKSTGSDLIHIKNAMLNKYYDDLFKKLELIARPTHQLASSEYGLGQRDGSNVRISPGVASNPSNPFGILNEAKILTDFERREK